MGPTLEVSQTILAQKGTHIQEASVCRPGLEEILGGRKFIWQKEEISLKDFETFCQALDA